MGTQNQWEKHGLLIFPDLECHKCLKSSGSLSNGLVRLTDTWSRSKSAESIWLWIKTLVTVSWFPHQNSLLFHPYVRSQVARPHFDKTSARHHVSAEPARGSCARHCCRGHQCPQLDCSSELAVHRSALRCQREYLSQKDPKMSLGKFP